MLLKGLFLRRASLGVLVIQSCSFLNPNPSLGAGGPFSNISSTSSAGPSSVLPPGLPGAYGGVGAPAAGGTPYIPPGGVGGGTGAVDPNMGAGMGGSEALGGGSGLGLADNPLLAAGLFGGGNLGSVQVDVNGGELATQIEGLNANLASMKGVWEGTNGQIGELTAQMDGLNQNLSSIQGTWEGTNVQIAQINQNWQESNHLLQQLLNPASAFLVGASAGLGFAAAGILVSTVFKGLKLAAEGIHEAVTHKKRDLRILEHLQVAQESYRKVRAASAEAQDRLDSLVYILKLVQNSGGKRNLLDQINVLIHYSENQEIILRDLSLGLTPPVTPRDVEHSFQRQISSVRILDGESQSNEEAETDSEGDLPFSSGVAQRSLAELAFDLKNQSKVSRQLVDSWIAQTQYNQRRLVQLRDSLENLPSDGGCNQLQTDYDFLVQSENVLQNARLKLIDLRGERIWEEAWNRQLIENAQARYRLKSPRQAKKLAKVREKIRKKSFQVLLKSDKELENQVYQSWRRCLKDKSKMGWVPLFGAITSQNSRHACWNSAIDPDSEYASEYRERLLVYTQFLELLPEGDEIGGSDRSVENQHPCAPQDDEKEEQLAKKLSAVPKTGDPEFNPRVSSRALANFTQFLEHLQIEQTIEKTEQRARILEEKLHEIAEVCDSGF